MASESNHNLTAVKSRETRLASQLLIRMSASSPCKGIVLFGNEGINISMLVNNTQKTFEIDKKKKMGS